MFANQFDSLPVLIKMASKGYRGAHVLGISYELAKSRNLIGSDVTFEQYNQRRLNAEQVEKTL